MGNFKSLPRDNPAQPIQDAAESALTEFIKSNSHIFSISNVDRNDYGSDYQLEAKTEGYRTNLRSHIQLKGSTAEPNADNSISINIEGSNLNYLIRQPRSIYVCFSLKLNKLFVRQADDIYRQYTREGGDWENQKTITIRFTQELDPGYLHKLHQIILDVGRGESNQRLEWAASPPESISRLLRRQTAPIEVPQDAEEARARLDALYKSGEDLVISNAFEQFRIVAEGDPAVLQTLYMAEVNLGLNGHPV